MKTIYTILFFADTLVLVLLSFLLLKMIDNGGKCLTFAATVAGIVCSIIVLFLFLRWFLKTPPPNSHS